MRDRRDGDHRHEHEAYGQQRDRARIRAQVAQRGEERARVEQGREDADEHDLRAELHIRRARHEADAEPAQDEQDRIRDAHDGRQHEQRRRSHQQREQDERVMGGDRHGQDGRSDALRSPGRSI